MPKTAVCTISTSSHLFKSRAALASVANASEAHLYCLLMDDDKLPLDEDGITYHDLDAIDEKIAISMRKKYSGNKLRWGFKPLYLSYLLKMGYDSVIYIDNDIFFFSSPDFLFEKLKKSSVLLTPHYYPSSPDADQNWLEANYTVGLYNAGFVGVSQNAVQALDWWASCCLYNIKKSGWRGLFDDQKYLDLLPVIFEDVEIIRHRGCNVAGWNVGTSIRSKGKSGELVLGDGWPLVFIHFTPTTYRSIINGKDDMLKPYMEMYLESLRRIKPSYIINEDLRRSWRDVLLYFRYIRWIIARCFE